MVVSDQARGLAIIGVAAPLGSFFGLFMRLLEHYGPFGVLALRGSCQVVFFLCVLLRTRGFGLGRDIHAMGRLGALAVLGMAGQNFGISVAMLMTTVSNVFFCISTAPAFCIIGDAIFLKERVPCRTWLMVIACLTGVTIILVGSYSSGGSVAGCLVALINPISWATFWGIQRHRSKTDEKRVKAELPLVLLCAQVLLVSLGTVVGIASGSLADGIDDAQKRSVVLLDIFMIVFFGAIYLPFVQFLMSLAPRYIPTAQVACVKITETIWGPLWVFLFKGEKPDNYTIIGGAVIFCAVLGNSLAILRDSASKELITDCKDLDAVAIQESEPESLEEAHVGPTDIHEMPTVVSI